jgi:uncharacterized protein
MASPWHRGERAVQERTAEAHLADRVAGGIRHDLPDVAAQFLAGMTQMIAAGVDRADSLHVSVLAGSPGFVEVLRPDLVRVGATPTSDDPLAGAVRQGAPVGLLALDPTTRTRVRLNGRVVTGEMGLTVQLDEVFANCPKYIRPRAPAAAAMPAGPIEPRRSTGLTPAQIGRLQRADTFFVGTTDGGVGVDASHRGGPPGFVVVVDANHLTFPDYRGNSMYRTLGNLEVDDRVGLFVLDWETGAGLHLSGTAAVVFEPCAADLARLPGARRLIDVEIGSVIERPAASSVVWRDADPS